MTDQPTPSVPLPASEVALLQRGDWWLCKTWGPMQFDRFDDSERRAFSTDTSGQARLMVPAGNLFLGRPSPDGFIPWSGGENPAPGMRVDVRFEKGRDDLGSASEGWAWNIEGAWNQPPIVAWKPHVPASTPSISAPDGVLLPCPFCGCAVKASEYAVDDEGHTKWAVGCDCSGAPEDQPYAERYINVHGFTRAEAIAAWNRRAPSISTKPRGGATDEIQRRAYDLLAEGVDGFAALSAAKKTDIHRVLCAALSEPKGEGGASEAWPVEVQRRVNAWMLECFGEAISADQVGRADRFVEEALELVQSVGYSADRAHALVDYVFGRPVGEPSQEVGGVVVTLAALCNTFGLDIQAAADTEIDRITRPEIVLKIRAKQAAKPTGSALPIATPPAEADKLRVAVEALDGAAGALEEAAHSKTRTLEAAIDNLAEVKTIAFKAAMVIRQALATLSPKEEG